MIQIKIIVFIVSLILPMSSWAKGDVIFASGTYIMSDYESPQVAESKALLEAKKVAIEQAGTYVKSYTKVKDYQLAEDEVEVVAAGVIKVKILKKKRTITKDGIEFSVTIEAIVDTIEIQKLARETKNDRQMVDNYLMLKQEFEKQAKKVEEIKRQLSRTVSEKEIAEAKIKILDEEKIFKAFDWIDKGRLYIQKNKLEEAIEAFTSAITLNPNYAFAYFSRSFAYMKKEQYERALADTNKAIDIDPKVGAHYAFRGAIYWVIKQHEDAIKEFTNALSLDPDSFWTFTLLGNAYFETGKLHEALDNFNRAISINPDYYLAYQGRGKVYISMKQFDKALADANKAINLNLFDTGGYTLRCQAYNVKGQYDRAIEDCTAALNIAPKNRYAYIQRALAYSEQEKYEKTIEDYSKAIQILPNDMELGKLADDYADRGGYFLKIGQDENAFEDFKKALTLDSNNSLAHVGLTTLYLQNKEYDKAISQASKLIQRKPNDYIGYFVRGNIYLEKRQFEQAIEDYEKGLALNPEDQGVYYNLSCIYSLKKNTKKACYYLKKSIEKGNKNWGYIVQDKDLDNIRIDDCYKELVPIGKGLR